MIAEETDFERKLNEATAGLQSYIGDHLLERISRTNASIIVDYVLALKSEVNPSDYYRQTVISNLKHLSEFHKNVKSFKEMTREDIIFFLDTLRKKDWEDELHHWIGTYNHNVITINRFFKWLYDPLAEPNQRQKPPVIQKLHLQKNLIK